jgi:hypothetical protein
MHQETQPQNEWRSLKGLVEWTEISKNSRAPTDGSETLAHTKGARRLAPRAIATHTHTNTHTHTHTHTRTRTRKRTLTRTRTQTTARECYRACAGVLSLGTLHMYD